jgi:hypothetical protein
MIGFLPCFIGWLGRETGYGPVDRSAGVLGIVSRAVTPSNYVGGSWKVATYGDRPQEAYAGCTWTGVGSVCVVLVKFPLQGVHRFESPRLSDMSNRLFMAVFT